MAGVANNGGLVGLLVFNIVLFMTLLFNMFSDVAAIKIIILSLVITIAIVSWPVAHRHITSRRKKNFYSLAQFGLLASGVMHDITSPMTVVQLNLEAIARRLRLSSAKGSEADKINLRRALKAISQVKLILQASQRQIQQQGEITYFSVRQEIDQVVQLLNYKSKRHQVKIIVDGQPGIKLHGSPVKFSQIITNLLTNAIDSYLNRSSQVNKRVKINIQRNNNELVVTVKDWGQGMTANQLARAFEAGYTTKHIDEGSGLGLSISKTFVEEDFQGQLRLNSTLTEGTTVTIFLPRNTLAVS